MAKRFNFTYLFCNELDKMTWFYEDILQLERIWESDRSVAFKIGSHQLAVELKKDLETPSAEFAMQPGWKGGGAPRTSWSLECDEDDFQAVVQASQRNDVRSFFPEPKWKGYWSFPVLDPMNNTIEITCTERETVPITTRTLSNV
ncbi:VOC family protein [Alteribacter aurantiacus]|uniref:VOC family protein n=1 Tax=Alteribacter aurantiacus TaxID=254410 RepID=UPI0003FF201F|nr:VOC family protein [Alteribacter aurantiacus]